jgi:hypothetical protein
MGLGIEDTIRGSTDLELLEGMRDLLETPGATFEFVVTGRPGIWNTELLVRMQGKQRPRKLLLVPAAQRSNREAV